MFSLSQHDTISNTKTQQVGDCKKKHTLFRKRSLKKCVRSTLDTRENNSRELCGCSTLLEMGSSVLDHMWTQDSFKFPLFCEHELGPYIDQGNSKTKV